jgi:choice-of-anchor B domain-containing protein
MRRLLPFAFAVFAALPLTPAASAQQFGGSLAISGGQVLVGEAGQSVLPGVVYVYGRDGGAWSELTRLRVTESGGAPDGFGRAIAAGATSLLIGAPLANDGAGAAYLFRSDGSGGWSESARLGPPAGSGTGQFGAALAMSGVHTLIGAPAADGGAGAVHAMRLSGDGWQPNGTLVSGGTPGFGSRLAIDGAQLLVASASPRGGSADVVLYTTSDDGTWIEQARLEAEAGERSGFGSALALHGGRAFVGAPLANGNVGGVFVFSPDEGGEWVLDRRLAPFEAEPNTRFGSSIAFDGDVLIVGAPGATGVGELYVFEPDTAGGWAAAFRDGPVEPVERASFASTLRVAGDVSVIGASGVDGGAGAAFVYERSADGVWAESAMLVNEVRGFDAITGSEVTCEEGRAAIFECDEVNITAFLPIKDIGGGRGTRVNDIWGWTDPETGREYALVGRTDGTSFVDISDPYAPRYLGDLPKTEGSRSMIWRDIKVHADHAYIVADAAGEHGVQVFDLRQLRDVGSEPVTFEETFLYDGIHSAHNIVINEATGFAYTVGNSGGGETCGGGYHMLNLEDPARPQFAGCFADPASGRRLTGYSHDAQCVIYHGPDAEYEGREICLGSNETMLNIADVTDKDASVSISNTSYPNVAYAHQGWLTEDHRYFYMNDEGDEPQGLVEGTRTLVWDVTDLDDPILVKEYIASTPDTDHNLYIVGDLMYQSNYGAGLRILDISNPEDPVEIAYFDNSPFGGASWSNYPFFESGIIAVTGTGDGLFLLKNTARMLVP